MENKSKVLTFDELKGFIFETSSYFNPPLMSMESLNDFAIKIYENAEIFVKRIDGKVVGMVAGYINNFKNKSAFISFVAVKKNFRGGGYAHCLINDFEEKCKQLNFKEILLKTGVNNSTQEMYKKLGYSEIFRDEKDITFKKEI